jgi:alpha-glucosidase (family GH31 glycosyl hydrolase)
MSEIWSMSPKGRTENIVQGDHYRFTLLTDRLIRMEYSEDGVFEDRPTQIVWNRTFAPVEYKVLPKDEGFELVTDRMRVIYDGKSFSKNGLSARGQGGLHPHGAVWNYGENTANLKGTARTLDQVNGECELQDGIMSFTGCAVIDDSKSLILTEEGWIEPRKSGVQDIYLFMYGCDYEEALSDFYALTGKTPMLPRFALGNWWSRYYAYTEESYKELVNRFEEEKVPFSVSVIDMDWHITQVDPKYGNGWTGFTWDTNLFPDPEGFLSWLHDHGLRTTLNLHPADGIRGFEKAYPQIAEAMGVDAEAEEPVHFDVADPKFLKEYFRCVLNPMEEEGVDFWWIDWQQGNNTKIPGLDPLWMLNHFHFLDSGRDGKRPMTFSRYAGPGSHRYPVGFSGDTITTWESLDFQPYFTNTASNIGYGWWSHDIGGHMMGYKDNEMAARWLQYGVFSPINRLHSSKSDFNGKEPWRYPMEIHAMMNDFLRLRHEMLPYLYTMNYRAWKEDKPIIEPMYYQYPREFVAYGMKNQYFFGSELMVAPITTPQIDKLNVGKVCVWLPEGTWIDFFGGRIYSGGHQVDMYRDIHSIPVLAKAGAIVPMTEEIFGTDALHNPESMTLRVFGGADGSFTLYEDDNETTAYLQDICATTDFTLDWAKGTFTIAGAKGHTELLPKERTYTVSFYGVKACEVSVLAGDETLIPVSTTYDARKGILSVTLPALPVEQSLEIRMENPVLRENPVKEELFDFINQAEIPFINKDKIYRTVTAELPVSSKLAALQSMKLDADLLGVLTEILTADGK